MKLSNSPSVSFPGKGEARIPGNSVRETKEISPLPIQTQRGGPGEAALTRLTRV
jgi:hypothetical protein